MVFNLCTRVVKDKYNSITKPFTNKDAFCFSCATAMTIHRKDGDPSLLIFQIFIEIQTLMVKGVVILRLNFYALFSVSTFLSKKKHLFEVRTEK